MATYAEELIQERPPLPNKCPRDHTPIDPKICEECGYIRTSEGCNEPISYDELLRELSNYNNWLFDFMHIISRMIHTELGDNKTAMQIEFELQANMSHHYRRMAHLEQLLANKIVKGDTK